MIATLRRRLIAIPARLTRHAGHLDLRLPPGHGLLAEVVTRLRALPAVPWPPARKALARNLEPAARVKHSVKTLARGGPSRRLASIFHDSGSGTSRPAGLGDLTWIKRYTPRFEHFSQRCRSMTR
jgi:hypothetical protein